MLSEYYIIIVLIFLFRFIGEESVAAGIKCELTDVPTWIIDPVDGTTNFVHRFVSVTNHNYICMITNYVYCMVFPFKMNYVYYLTGFRFPFSCVSIGLAVNKKVKAQIDKAS